MSNEDQKKNKDIVHYDINLARLPWIHTNGKKNGPWSFKTEGGMVAGNRRLTKGELIVYTELMRLFEEAKMPLDGKFFDTQNAIMHNLVSAGGKNRAIGGFQKRRLKQHLYNLNRTFFSFNGCFEANGIRKTVMVGFSLLEEATLYEKKNDEEYFLSKFRLPQSIVENMRDGFWKPIKLAVITSIKSERALALYMLLDRILGVQDEFNKDLKDLCDEIGISFARQRNYVTIMKKTCKVLVGYPLTCGQEIAFCHIVESQTASGFKIFARRGKMRSKERPALPIKPSSANPVVDQRDREEVVLMTWFTKLSLSQQEIIIGRVEEIAKEMNPNPWWKSELSLHLAKLESIRRYYHDATCARIINKEGTIKVCDNRNNPYGPDPEPLRKQPCLLWLAFALQNLAIKKQSENSI